MAPDPRWGRFARCFGLGRASAILIGGVLAGQASLAAAQAAPAPPVAAGQALYEQRCTGCHSVDEHRVGPMHRGVLGRRAGGAPGYAYSAALRTSTLVWTPERLRQWLRDPESLIPGQQMGYRVNEAADREVLVAYLASLR